MKLFLSYFYNSPVIRNLMKIALPLHLQIKATHIHLSLCNHARGWRLLTGSQKQAFKQESVPQLTLPRKLVLCVLLL